MQEPTITAGDVPGNWRMATVNDSYYGWAIVELMGHRQVAGRVFEINAFGVSMMRVVTPIIAEPGKYKIQDYGGAAIYCLNHCDEETAMAFVRQLQPVPWPRALEPHEDPVDPELNLVDDDDDESTDCEDWGNTEPSQYDVEHAGKP